jgi:hypothetical protein
MRDLIVGDSSSVGNARSMRDAISVSRWLGMTLRGRPSHRAGGCAVTANQDQVGLRWTSVGTVNTKSVGAAGLSVFLYESTKMGPSSMDFAPMGHMTLLVPDVLYGCRFWWSR